MRPEYIAIQAAIIRGFARNWGFTFPQLQLTDAELVAWFQNTIKQRENQQ